MTTIDEGAPIAVIGMAGIFPGAADLDAYWRNLEGGVDAIGEVPPARWDPAVFGAAPEEPPSADRFACRRGGFVDDVATFDPHAFGIMPVAVDDAEPDQLLALRVGAEAIADAGGTDRVLTDPERVGVVLGRGGYLSPGLARIDQRVRVANQVAEVLRDIVPDLDPAQVDAVRRAFQDRIGPERPEASIGLVPNLAASRIANRLDLQGPAFTVDAACASSLVAIDHAVRELRSGRCDVMLAGGTHHCHDVTLWSVFTQLGALSRRQQIRPFHREADGLLIGEGTGIVVLKRLVDAEADGDRVYAVVRGTGVASDGRDSSLMKPKVAGQVLALQRAWTDAAGSGPALDPASIGLVEAHGTATPAGDDAELRTLAAFFGAPEGEHRAGLGSVKSMIGHAMPAAGIAGFIKAALALHHKVLPPTLHADDPNPALADTRFRLVEQAEPWELDDVMARPLRRAAVNAFGFGGINAHIVLDEAPTGAAPSAAPARTSVPGCGTAQQGVVCAPRAGERVVLLAAETVGALAAQLGTGEEADAALLVRDDAGRPLPSGAVRLAIVDPTPKRLGIARKIVAQGKRWLGRNDIWFSPTPRLGAAGGLVALVFPGVEPVFDPRVDDIAPWFGWDAIEERDTSQLGHQGRAIVDVGRLLHRALAELGVRADHLAGHSIGEWTGMVASELIPSDRADEFIDSIDPGALEVPGVIFAAMGCGADVSAELIDGLPDVVISHDNCPHQSILCGAEASVREALDRARARKVIGQELPFRSGFHSPMFAPFLEPIRVHLDQMPVQAPSTPLWSATLADRYPTDDGEVRDLVIRHLLEPVRFQPLLRRLADEGVRAVVQLGVGSLVGFVDDTFPIGNPETGALLAVPATTPKREGLDQLRRVLAGLWSEGLDTVRFDRLPTGPDTATALTSAPAVDKPAGAMLSLGAPFVRLTDSGIRLTPVTPGAADRAATNLAGSADPVLAELGAMLAETSRAGDELLALLDGSAPARTPAPFAATTPSGSVPAAAPAQADEPADAPVIERTATVPVSVDAMPWLLDHCFYRQPAGWPHAEDRFPVVPMTALIEILVEQAEALVPGRVAVAVNEIRALRWTAVAPATELTVKAKRTGESSDGIEVRVTIEGYARGTVVLAPAHPAPPAPDQTPLTGEVPSAVDAHQLYADRWMFHGPEYQGVTRLGPIASDGIDGVITTPAAPGALLDNAGQLMGYWMMQAAELDRLALPMTVGSVRFFGAHPTAGTDVTCRVWIDEVTDDGIRTHMELTVEGDGGAPVVWCRIADWYDKRFDSDDVVWPLFQHPEHRDLAEEQDGGWVLVRERWRSTASRELMVRRYTDAAERADYDRRNPRDQRQWLLGRIAAKDAVRRSVWGGAAPDARAALFPIEAGIDHLPSGQPIVTAPPAMAGRPLSIAHTDGLAVAMVGAPGGAVGIDVERIDARTPRFADLTLTATEQALVGPDDAALTTAWTVKEAAAKAAGSGLEGRPKQFQISSIDGSHFVVATPDGPRRLDTTTIRTPEGDFVVAWTLSDD